MFSLLVNFITIYVAKMKLVERAGGEAKVIVIRLLRPRLYNY